MPPSHQRRGRPPITQPTTSDDRRQRATTLATDLYVTHRRRLLSIANHNAPSPEDAEEALHDAFVLFINHFDPDSAAPPLAWITLTLKRRCWASHRHLQLTQRLTSPTGHLPAQAIRNTLRLPEELLEATETTQHARHLIARLKPDERRALTLLALGYSYREICDLTDWTYTKVNRCIAEGRARLRTPPQDTYPTPPDST